MFLHTNDELFEDAIKNASENFGVAYGIVEKDYYVYLLLKEMAKRVPSLIFKGGTSLSKCYHLINRFSEDIDLNLEEAFPTQSIKKDTKYNIIESVAAVGLDLTNKDEIWTRTNYNKYKIDYSSRFAVDGVKPNLYVETYYSIPAFPTELREVSSLLYEFLHNAGFDSIVAEYELAPFEIRVQSIVRTFIDKVFAVCDCYLDGRVTEHSRHLYDIYKIYPHIKFDDEFGKLVAQTREVRRNSQKSSAAEVGVDISRLLQEIIDRKIYKSDYRDITQKLLFEEADYDVVIGTLQDIAIKNYFA